MPQQLTHLWPEAPARSGPLLECRARIESADSPHDTLWYRVPEERAAWLTESADAFLLGFLLVAMFRGSDLRIHGAVSPSLLRNLDDFQAAWAEWWPNRYRRVEIGADQEREESPGEGASHASLTFSGGLDSSFSAWRHARGAAGRARVAIGAALMIHGFDIPLAEPEVFARAARRSETLLGSLGVDLVTISTNAREMVDDWEQTHGAALASCLHLLRRGFSTGLIASSHTYGTLRVPWGSNPLTDPLLSTAGFPVSYDGTAFTRRQKARAVAAWPEAMTHLRVCWEGPEKDRNCGECVRCVGTAVCFAVEGLPVPPCLRIDSLERAIIALRGRAISPTAVARLSELRDGARAAGIDESWVVALDRLVRYKRVALPLGEVRHAIGRRVRAFLGGSGGEREVVRAPIPPPRRASSPDLYREIDAESNRQSDLTTGFGMLIRAGAHGMDEAAVGGFRARYPIIKRFQQRTLELFRASLRGECDPEIADMIVAELPGHLGRTYHRELTDRQHRTPVFFRTDELPTGRLAEIQCCGSGWGIAEQLRVLYDAHPDIFGVPRFFPQTLARQFAASLEKYLGREPIVHHLVDNASRPHGSRYFIGRLRDQGVRHFGHDSPVRPEDCNFIRSHDFITLPHHNFFADRLERCNRGEVFFDLPPSSLFDVKMIQAWPFWEKTRDWYDDEVRSLFPHTSIVGREGVVLSNDEFVTIEDFCRRPPRERQYYVKYAGTDISTNWGSKAVFLASSFSQVRCRDMMSSVVADRQRRHYWIIQESIRRNEEVAAFDRGGGTVDSTSYGKYSAFYGPDGLMAILAFHLRSHKVHGSTETIASLVR